MPLKIHYHTCPYVKIASLHLTKHQLCLKERRRETEVLPLAHRLKAPGLV